MISSPSPLTFTFSPCVSGKLRPIDSENPAKRSFAQHNEDQLSQLELKRRNVHHSKRAPLDLLSASKLENRRSHVSRSADSASHHSFFLSDLGTLHPARPASSGSPGMQRSSISDALVCAWPPPTAPPGTSTSSHSTLAGKQCGPLHSPVDNYTSRATLLESISTRVPPDSLLTETTPTMMHSTPTTGWQSESQPIRPRAHSMPLVHGPPDEHWRSGSQPTEVDHEPVDTADSSIYLLPPGLTPRRPGLGRTVSYWDLQNQGSVTLSLALGSLPLQASEHTKAVPPIGAERSAVSVRSHAQDGPVAQTHGSSGYPSPIAPRPVAQWKNETCLLNSPAQVQTTAGNTGTTKEDFERLLRHALRNKHAPKVVSPLNPLRAATLPLGLSSDPAYRQRMPSRWNSPSPRYSTCPPKRTRTVCDLSQSPNWDSTCMHCQECKRDSVCKKLLATHYRQQLARYTQRFFPSRCGNPASAMSADHVVWEMPPSYEMDDEEKKLWADIAAITGEGPSSISRAGVSCTAATHRRGMTNGSDDAAYDDYPHVTDESFCANESGTLFREVSVY